MLLLLLLLPSHPLICVCVSCDCLPICFPGIRDRSLGDLAGHVAVDRGETLGSYALVFNAIQNFDRLAKPRLAAPL